MGLTVTERDTAIRVVRKEVDKQKAAAMVDGKPDLESARVKAIEYVKSDGMLEKLAVMDDYVTRIEKLQAEAVEYGRVLFNELNALDGANEEYSRDDSYYSSYKVTTASDAKTKIKSRLNNCIENNRKKFFDATPTGQKIVFLDKVSDEAGSRIMLCTASDKLVNALKAMMAQLGVTYDI